MQDHCTTYYDSQNFVVFKVHQGRSIKYHYSLLFDNVTDSILQDFHGCFTKMLQEDESYTVVIDAKSIAKVPFSILLAQSSFMKSHSELVKKKVVHMTIHCCWLGSLLLNTLFTLVQPSCPMEVIRNDKAAD